MATFKKMAEEKKPEKETGKDYINGRRKTVATKRRVDF